VVSVEDLRHPKALQCFPQRFHTEVGGQRVGEAEGQHLAAGDVQDRHQIQKPVRANTSGARADRNFAVEQAGQKSLIAYAQRDAIPERPDRSGTYNIWSRVATKKRPKMK
jgi:hypothetical protein